MSAPPKSFGFLLYENFAALDAFGPLAFFSNLPAEYDVKIHFISDKLAPIEQGTLTPTVFPSTSKTGVRIVPTHTLENAPPLDVLVIPGGYRAPDEQWSRFVKERYSAAKYVFTVCTGTIVAAQAGIIDGRRATTNKFMFEQVASFGRQVEWVPSARWVTDGNVWSSSGVEAGTDQAYAFVAEVYGAEVAKDIASRLELDPQTDPSFDPFAIVWTPKVGDTKPTFLPADAWSTFQTPPTVPSKHYGFVLYPGFNPLDLISVFEYIQGMSVFMPITVSFIAQTLDPVAPGGTTLLPESFIPGYVFTEPPSTPLDVLILPGSAVTLPESQSSKIVKFIQSVYPTLERIITVSTGSLLAASAGILNGRRATLPTSHWDETAAYPSVDWVRKARYVVSEGGEKGGKATVYTASGSAAGLDAGFKLMVDMYGEEMARLTSTVLEYTPHEDSEWDLWTDADA